MKMGLVLSTNDPETNYNALRLANFCKAQGDEVAVFLLGKGVEVDRINSEKFEVRGQAEALLKAGGRIAACGTCLRVRSLEGSETCPISTMKDLYELIRESDRVVSF
ncbi:MAG: DsrE family protein [Pirellulales bacterium]|nr:DsrE family protein [Pirellulales bacterium]